MAAQTIITVNTSGAGLYEISHEVARFVRDNAADGPALLTVFIRHTSASLTIQENADPDVQVDLQAYINRLAPPTTDPAMAYLTHTTEGPDDMPAHIRAALTDVSLSIPVMDARIMLGTWQGIYVWEHRARPHTREVVLHVG
ncbi:MAG: secondary thiamine-phosphate synthase enzyme YjbQ [Pseudomonadota bacterium]